MKGLQDENMANMEGVVSHIGVKLVGGIWVNGVGLPFFVEALREKMG